MAVVIVYYSDGHGLCCYSHDSDIDTSTGSPKSSVWQCSIKYYSVKELRYRRNLFSSCLRVKICHKSTHSAQSSFVIHRYYNLEMGTDHFNDIYDYSYRRENILKRVKTKAINLNEKDLPLPSHLFLSLQFGRKMEHLCPSSLHSDDQRLVYNQLR